MYWYMHWCVEFENENAFQMYKRIFYCTHTHTHTHHTHTHTLLMSLLFDQFDDVPTQMQLTGVVDVRVPFTSLYIVSRFGNGWHSGSGDLLAGSMGWPILGGVVVVDRFHDVSHFHPFVQAQCDSLLCWLRVLLVVRKEPS